MLPVKLGKGKINMDTEKILTIPRETVDPVAMFHEDENPQEAALLEIQIDNGRYIWEAIVNREDFRAAEFVLKDGRKQILSPSIREGVDWQLSYIGSDGIPTMHGDFQEDKHYNQKGRSMEELYRELSHSETLNVTILLDKNEKGENSVDKNNSLFIADMARHYALYNRIPIEPESDFFKAYEAANGTVDRAQYRQILTDTLFHKGTPKGVILQPQLQDKDLSFLSWSEVNRDRVQSSNYEIVYVSEDISNLTPNEIYVRFNEPGVRPGNYYGTSVSMGNVIVYQNGENFIAYFVDRYGFQELSEDFLSVETKEKIEMSLDVRKEHELLTRITSFAQEQGVELDVTKDRERIAAIDRDFAVFNNHTGRTEQKREYTYYSLRRPVSIGTFPRDGIISFENFDSRTYIDEIKHEAWAKLIYSRELTSQELSNYEFYDANRNLAKYIEDYPHREDERSEKEMPKEQEQTATVTTAEQDEKKTAKDELSEQLMQGVKSVMESENYKNWLATSSSYFASNYSLRNAILIFRQKPEASYVKGYEAWKELGRNVGQGAKGAKIFVPVMAYDKNEGQLFRMVMSNLNGQIKANPEKIAVYRVGISQIEFTMNRNGQVGLRVSGKERKIFPNQQEIKKFISSAILGKVPMYYTVGTVFDVKDTIVPEYLWIKKGYTKDEVVKDENGKPIKNRKGEVKIVNTPERQAKYRPSLGLSINDEKDPTKMAILYDVLKTVSVRNGVPVTDVARESDETLSGGADGYFSRQFTPENPKGFIIMPDDLEPTRKVAVLLHEMGHSDLHGNLEKLVAQMGEKNIREIQAESVAYATARQFGIETDTSSFKYLAAYTQGFDMQDMEKSLDVIFRESKKLTQEIAAELDARGLNLDLTEKENEPMSRETVETLCKQYTAYALEQSDTVSIQMKELPSLAADNRNSPELLDVVTEQRKCMDRQLETVDAIHMDVKVLEGATTRDEQTAALERLEASKRDIEVEKKSFTDLVISFAEISSQSKATLKEEFVRAPLATLESMKKDFPKLESLSSMQLMYIAKSEYVKNEYKNLLKNMPSLFVDHVYERAEALGKVISKNKTFVEVNFCEQWTDKAITKDGAIMHPKVADSIIKQAEVQIQGLKAEAERAGDYFPYNKCDLTVFFKCGQDLAAFRTRVDIGDGGQTSLSDHLTQLCGKESDLVTAFDKATREKEAKDKIVFNEEINAAPEKTENVKEENKKTPEVFTCDEWANAIAQEKAGVTKEAQTADSPEKAKDKDNKEY